jgi:hypothetical protein
VKRIFAYRADIPCRSHSQVISKVLFVDDETVFTNRLKQPMFANSLHKHADPSLRRAYLLRQLFMRYLQLDADAGSDFVGCVRATAKASDPAAARYAPSPYWRSPDTARQAHGQVTGEAFK